MKDEEDTGAFSVTFQWDPQLLQIRDDYFNLPETDQVEGQFGIITAVFGGIIILCTAALWIMESQGIAPKRAAVMFFAGAAVAGAISVWAISRSLRLMFGNVEKWEQEAKNVILDEKPSQLHFGPDGFTEVTDHSTNALKWAAVKEIREFAFGIVLTLGPKHGVFIYDSTLPDGLDRAEAMRRFRKWKGPW